MAAVRGKKKIRKRLMPFGRNHAVFLRMDWETYIWTRKVAASKRLPYMQLLENYIIQGLIADDPTRKNKVGNRRFTEPLYPRWFVGKEGNRTYHHLLKGYLYEKAKQDREAEEDRLRAEGQEEG